MLLCLHEESRGRDRARLCQGHRADDGRGAAFERRPDARDDGDLQRVVRPRADAGARRDGPGRRREAPALDRLDPHGARPGRARARLHEVGRPAGVGRGGARGAAARRRRSRRRRRAAPVYVNLDAALQEATLGRAAAAAGRRALRAAGGRSQPDGAALADAARLLDAREAPVILMGRVSRSEADGGARRAGRATAGARSSPTSRSPPRFRPTIRCTRRRRARSSRPRHRGAARGRRRARARLGRPRRHADAGVRQRDAVAVRSDQRLARCATRIAAGAWTTRACRRPTSTWCASPMPSSRDLPLRSDRDAADARAGRDAASPPRAPAPHAVARTSASGPTPATTHDARGARRRRRRESPGGVDVCITRVPLGWHGAYRHFRHPLDYLGLEGGGGVGAGPGLTVGAALALKGSGRIPRRDHRRRRLPDGRDRAVDRGALPRCRA